MANLRKDTDFDWLDRIGFKCGDKVDVEVFIWDPEMPTPENLEYDFFEYWSRKRRTVNTPSGRVCRARNRVADHIEDAVSSMKSGLVPTHGWWRREVHRYKSPTEFKVRKETREASFYEVKAIISTKHALKPTASGLTVSPQLLLILCLLCMIVPSSSQRLVTPV